MPVTLATLRTRSKARADMERSDFADTSVWNGWINESYAELWDEVVAAFGDHFVSSADTTVASGASTIALPADFYLLRGIDRDPDTDAAYDVQPFQWGERNQQFGLSYHMRGGVVDLRPISQAPGNYRVWYVPGYVEMASDSDAISATVERWAEFITISAAIKALTKEESDTGALERALKAQRDRIITMAAHRDSGVAERVRDVRKRRWLPWLVGAALATSPEPPPPQPAPPQPIGWYDSLWAPSENAHGSIASLVQSNSTPMAPGEIMLLPVAHKGGRISAVTSSSGATWTLVKAADDGGGYLNGLFLGVYRSMVAVPVASDTVTVTFDGALPLPSLACFAGQGFYNVDTAGTGGSGAIVQSVSAVDATSPVLATLGAFESTDNATVGCFANLNSAGAGYLTAGAGFEAAENTAAYEVPPPAIGVMIEFVATPDTTVDAILPGGNTMSSGLAIGIELRRAT